MSDKCILVYLHSDLGQMLNKVKLNFSKNLKKRMIQLFDGYNITTIYYS